MTPDRIPLIRPPENWQCWRRKSKHTHLDYTSYLSGIEIVPGMVFEVCADESTILPLGAKFIIETYGYDRNYGSYASTINVWGARYRLSTHYFTSCNIQLVS